MPYLLRPFLLLSLSIVLRAADPILTVVCFDQTLRLTAAEIAALPHSECLISDPHNGHILRYSGVAVRYLLGRVGAPLGAALRGPALQLAVIARGQDGYNVIYALAEFDEAFSDRTILLADRQDDKPLPATAAPLQLIIPGDKRAARSVRMVTLFEIVRAGATAKP